jgi:hypothetical protein
MADLQGRRPYPGQRDEVSLGLLQDRERQDPGTGGEVEGAIGHRVTQATGARERAIRAAAGE